jgi:hypothetical protein
VFLQKKKDSLFWGNKLNVANGQIKFIPFSIESESILVRELGRVESSW